MNLLKNIKELAACKRTDAPFISLYLNTRGTESGKRYYEIFLKEKLTFFEKEFAGNRDIEKNFKKSWEQIQHYLNNKLELNSNGAVLFSPWQPNENFFPPLHIKYKTPLDEVWERFWVNVYIRLESGIE